MIVYGGDDEVVDTEASEPPLGTAEFDVTDLPESPESAEQAESSSAAQSAGIFRAFMG
jgi:hypothetical protein